MLGSNLRHNLLAEAMKPMPAIMADQNDLT